MIAVQLLSGHPQPNKRSRVQRMHWRSQSERSRAAYLGSLHDVRVRGQVRPSPCE